MTTKTTVFVVDDDESIRKALSRLIRSSGLEVEAFASAQAFLAREPADCPACLVLDVRLPQQSGLDLQDELKRTGWEMPVVFITGHGDVPTSVRAMKAGAVDFLQKPVGAKQFLDTIRRALARDREVRGARAEREAIQQRVDSLTPRERQVLTLVVAGLLNKQIAAELGASEKTIKVHRGRVMQKMHANSVADLVRMGQKVNIGP